MKRITSICYIIICLVFIMSTRSHSSEMSGKVIDSITNSPIPDAVILVEWTKTSGFGFTSTDLYKVFETKTDQSGGFTISGVSNPFVNQPRITIYKKGYVAWNNEYIFPKWDKRTDFKWAKSTTIVLKPFTSEYSRGNHVLFLNGVTHWGKLINQEFHWEELEYEKNKIK